MGTHESDGVGEPFRCRLLTAVASMLLITACLTFPLWFLPAEKGAGSDRYTRVRVGENLSTLVAGRLLILLSARGCLLTLLSLVLGVDKERRLR